MKKQFFLLSVLFVVLFAGCSKDDDDLKKALVGNWTVVHATEVYQNADGTPFRDDDLTEDLELIEPGYPVLVTDKVVKLAGVVTPYTLSKGYFILGEVGAVNVRFDYIIQGDEMTWKNVTFDYEYKTEEAVTFVVPKVTTTLILKKQL